MNSFALDAINPACDCLIHLAKPWRFYPFLSGANRQLFIPKSGSDFFWSDVLSTALFTQIDFSMMNSHVMFVEFQYLFASMQYLLGNDELLALKDSILFRKWLPEVIRKASILRRWHYLQSRLGYISVFAWRSQCFTQIYIYPKANISIGSISQYHVYLNVEKAKRSQYLLVLFLCFSALNSILTYIT